MRQCDNALHDTYESRLIVALREAFGVTRARVGNRDVLRTSKKGRGDSKDNDNTLPRRILIVDLLT